MSERATTALAESWASIDGKELDEDGGYIEDAKSMQTRLATRGFYLEEITQGGIEWGDKKDDLTPKIDKCHPMDTGKYHLYDKAVRLVGNRYSKYAIVDLVNYHLLEIERLKEECKRHKKENK